MTNARNKLEAMIGQLTLTASRTSPLHSVALRVMNTAIQILLLEPINPIDNPHRGSGDFHEKAVKCKLIGTWLF